MMEKMYFFKFQVILSSVNSFTQQSTQYQYSIVALVVPITKSDQNELEFESHIMVLTPNNYCSAVNC